MEPHCALKVPEHLLKNKVHYHHNANDRFEIMPLSVSTRCKLEWSSRMTILVFTMTYIYHYRPFAERTVMVRRIINNDKNASSW